MPADNSIYDTQASGWWDENNFLHILKTGLNPVRFEYFQTILNHQGLKLPELNVLDIGCGGGILSEEFARMGCAVRGIDISASSVSIALKHARNDRLKIEYQVGSALALPFSTASFDVVVCCDVLEHLPDLTAAIAEAARVLKPGGTFLFDTINRTLRSYFETILIAQELPLTRFFAPGSHDWHQFIPPHQLEDCFKLHQLALGEFRGLQSGISPLVTALQIFRLKLGQINFAEFGKRLSFHIGDSLDSSYIGYALKP